MANVPLRGRLWLHTGPSVSLAKMSAVLMLGAKDVGWRERSPSPLFEGDVASLRVFT